MSNVALAQTLQSPGTFPTTPGETAPGSASPYQPPFTVPDLDRERDHTRDGSEMVAPRDQTGMGVSGIDRSLAARVPAIDAPLDPDAYVCGPGDILELNFWGVQNFKLRVTVDLEGRAFVPKTGFLDLGGKTLSQARRIMRDSVARFYPRLSFDVTLAEPRTFLVQVVDDVKRPGSYPARALDRVASLIARAGGFGPNASRRRIEIRRRDGKELRADLLVYSLTGDVAQNPYLLDGDVVRVPFEELAATVDGAVNRPGRYELTGKRDLAELVELAGGLAPTATQRLPISLVRRSKEDRQDQTLLPFGADGSLPTATIQHEDSVRIPAFADLQRSVMIIGAIAGATAPNDATATRRLPFVQGDSVRTLLDRVGGVGPLADLTGAYVLRNGTSLPVNLYQLVMVRDLSADRPVELGDSLVVPFKRRSILVEGAVFKAGEYPYNPNFGIQQYLSLAGGRNRFAQGLSSVRVVTPNGETKKYASDLNVEPGSSVIVPERNFSRSEVVQIFLGAAGIVLSGVAVVISARK
ncbi:SLBB domain-containing protein [Anaeromyxobacter soli]|uniref:SLBB domain-containing protein n=1 Tax=Anaeromyxobacter soli TaxID=2922725 RepID=UPI001FAEA86F|nr:polysaccharide biosynthesis/export family protein [Anaeromyxobacter sp. SG29]